MTYSRLVSDVGTSDSPAWTNHDKVVWMAWKGQGTDRAIYVTQTRTQQPQSTTKAGTSDLVNGAYSFNPQQKAIDDATAASPAIVSYAGALYLFWCNAADGNIHWASCNDGKTWTNLQAIGIGDSLAGPSANNARATTNHAPTAVAANNNIYLFWRDTKSGKVAYATYSHGYWLQSTVSPASGGTPTTSEAPAVALTSSTIEVAWRGSGEGAVWWSSLPLAGGSGWTPQQQIFPKTTVPPAMICDGNGVVWLTWISDPADALSVSSIPWSANTASFGGAVLCFASLETGGKQWSTRCVREGISPGYRPALVSTAADSQSIMMSWRNPGTDQGIYYGALRLPAKSYVFEIKGFTCHTPRSGSVLGAGTDTNYAAISAQVTGTKQAITKTASCGDQSTGQSYSTPLSTTPVSVPDNGVVVMTYTLVNSSQPPSQVTGYLESSAEKLVQAGASYAASAAGAALGTAIGAAIGTGTVPLLGSALGALAGFLVSDAWGVLFPNCDGPIASAVRVMSAAQLLTATGATVADQQPSPGMQPPMVTQDGCGANPNYTVDWCVTPNA